MGDFFIDMINWIIEAIGGTLSGILDVFPDSPFQANTEVPEMVVIGYITWIFDFPTWIVHATAICSAVLSYYMIRVVARWVKLSRG